MAKAQQHRRRGARTCAAQHIADDEMYIRRHQSRPALAAITVRHGDAISAVLDSLAYQKILMAIG